MGLSAGGNGGAGGNGIVFDGGDALVISGAVGGGHGGTGGASAFVAGAGGSGGHGLIVVNDDALVTIDGNVTGGDGGDGGASVSTAGVGGSGGTGIMVQGQNVTLDIREDVAGGSGGAQGSGSTIGDGVGGAAITGADLTVLLGAGATAGLSGDLSTRGPALNFTGGDNTLSLLAGWSIQGSISVAGSLTLDQATDATLGASIDGSGGLVKDGAGTLILTGANTFSGGTTVDGGILSINGSVASLTMVGSGGTLKGTGNLSDTTVAAGGIHAPGNSIGTQTILGDYVNHGVLQIEVDPGHADMLKVGGTVDIDGAALDILLSSNDAALWDTNASPYTIIDNGSGTAVVGAFTPLANLVFLTADLNYAGGDGNDVTLTLARNTANFIDFAETGNQQAVAAAVEAQGSGEVYNTIVGANDIDLVRSSFDALSGEVHASLQGVLLDQSDMANRVNDRLRSAFDGVAASVAPVLSYRPDGPEFTAADTNDLVVWSQGIGALGEMGGNGNAAGIETRMGGLMAGADALVGDWRLGLVAGYSRSGFEVDDRTSSGDSDNYLLGLYGGTQIGGFGIRAGVAYGRHDLSTSRTVPLLSQTLTSDYGANTVQAFGELGYAFDLDSAVRFEPYADLAYVRLDTDGFSESGGSAALTSNGGTTDAALTTIGLRASTQMAWGETLATLHGGIGWRHAFADDPATLNAFAGGPDFNITGAPLTKDSAMVEAGLDLDLSANARFGITYTGQFAADMQDHGFSAKLAVGF